MSIGRTISELGLDPLTIANSRLGMPFDEDGVQPRDPRTMLERIQDEWKAMGRGDP